MAEILGNTFTPKYIMPAFFDHTFQSQHCSPTEQIRELQHAIQENTRRLAGVRQKRLRAEEELNQCTVETVRRMDLMIEKGKVVSKLLPLGHLLQEEKHLSEELNGQSSVDSNERNDLQERSERITYKARSLAAEIREVEKHLAETKARNMAARALIQTSTNKSKRNRSKPE